MSFQKHQKKYTDQHYPDLVKDNQPSKIIPNYKNLESFNLNDYLNSENNQRNSSEIGMTTKDGENSKHHEEDLYLTNHLKNIYKISSYIKRSSANPYYNPSTNSLSSESTSYKRHLSKSSNNNCFSTFNNNTHNTDEHVISNKKPEENHLQNQPFKSQQNSNNNNFSKITRKTVHCNSKKSVKNSKTNENVFKEDSNENIYSWRKCQEMMISQMRNNKREINDKEIVCVTTNPSSQQKQLQKEKRSSKSAVPGKKTPPKPLKQHSSHKASLLEMYPTSKMTDKRALMISSGADSLHCFLTKTTNNNNQNKSKSQKKPSSHIKSNEECTNSSQGVSNHIRKDKMDERLKQKCREYIRKKAMKTLSKEDFDDPSNVETTQTNTTHKASKDKMQILVTNKQSRVEKTDDDSDETIKENSSNQPSLTTDISESSEPHVKDHQNNLNQPISSQSSSKTSTSYKSPLRDYQSEDIRSYMRRKKQQHRQQQLDAAKQAEVKEEHKRKMLLRLKQFQQSDLSSGKKHKQVKSLKNRGMSNYHKKTLAMTHNIEKWLDGQKEVEEKKVKDEASRSFKMANQNETKNGNKPNKTLNCIDDVKMESSGKWEAVMENLRTEQHLFFNKIHTTPTSLTTSTTIISTNSPLSNSASIHFSTTSPTNLTTSVHTTSLIKSSSSMKRDTNHTHKYKQLDKYKYSASCLSDKLAHMESILRDLKKRRDPFFPRSPIDNEINTVTKDSTTSPREHQEYDNITYVDTAIQNNLDSYNNNNKSTCVTPSITYEAPNNKSTSTTLLACGAPFTSSQETNNTNISLYNSVITTNPTTTSFSSSFNHKFSTSSHNSPTDYIPTQPLSYFRVPDDLKKVELLNEITSYDNSFLGGLKSTVDSTFMHSDFRISPTHTSPITTDNLSFGTQLPGFSPKPFISFLSTAATILSAPQATSSYANFNSSSSLFIQPPSFLTSTPPALTSQATSTHHTASTTSSHLSTKPITSTWMSSLRDIFPSEDVCIKMRKQLGRPKSPTYDPERPQLYSGFNDKWNNKDSYDNLNLNESNKEAASPTIEVDNVNDLNKSLLRTFLASPDNNIKTTASKVRQEVLSQTSGNLFDSLNESNLALNDDSLVGKQSDKIRRKMKKKVVTDDVFPSNMQSNASFTSSCTSDAGGLAHDTSMDPFKTPSLMPSKQLERFLVKREMTLKRRKQRALMMIEKSKLLDDQERQVELLEKEASSLAKKAAPHKGKSKAANGGVETPTGAVVSIEPSKRQARGKEEGGVDEGGRVIRKEEKKRKLRQLIQEYEKELAELSMTESSILSSSFSQTLKDELERPSISKDKMDSNARENKDSFDERIFSERCVEENGHGASDSLVNEVVNMKIIQTKQKEAFKTENKNDVGLVGGFGELAGAGGMVGDVVSTDAVNVFLSEEVMSKDLKVEEFPSCVVELSTSIRGDEMKEVDKCKNDKPPKKDVEKVCDIYSVFSKDSLERVVVEEKVMEVVEVASGKDSMESDTLNDEMSHKSEEKTEDDVEDIDVEQNVDQNKFSVDSLMVPDKVEVVEKVETIVFTTKSSETTATKEAVKIDGILEVSDLTSSTTSTQTKDLIGDVDDLIQVIKSADHAVKSVSSERLNDKELDGVLDSVEHIEAESDHGNLKLERTEEIFEKVSQPEHKSPIQIVKQPDDLMMSSFESIEEFKNENLIYEEEKMTHNEGKLTEPLSGIREEERRNTAYSLVDQLLSDLLRQTIDSVLLIRKNKLIGKNVAEMIDNGDAWGGERNKMETGEVVLQNFELADDKHDIEDISMNIHATTDLSKYPKMNNTDSPLPTPVPSSFNLNDPNSRLSAHQPTYHAPKVTSFVPISQEALIPLITSILDIYWQQRRCGLSWQDYQAPESFLREGGDAYLEQGFVCQRAFKMLLWDLVGEILVSLYSIEEEAPQWSYDQGKQEGFTCDIKMFLAAEKLINRRMLYDKNSLPNTTQELKPIMMACINHLVTSSQSNVDLAIFSGIQASKVSCHPERNEGIRQVLAMEMRVEEAGWNNLDKELREVREETFESVLQWLIDDTLVNVCHAFNRKKTSV